MGQRFGGFLVVLTRAIVSLCIGVAGVGGFLDYLEKLFFLAKWLGAVLPLQVEFFFYGL